MTYLNRFLLVLCLFKTSFVYSNDFSNIRIEADSAPYVMVLILQHLKEIPPGPEVSSDILDFMSSINENLINLDQVNRTFLTTSEVYKSILNYRMDFLTFKQKVTIQQIKDIKKKFDQNQTVYSSFSQFIIDSVLKDFEPYLAKDFLSRYHKQNTFDTKEYKKSMELKKRLKYSGPWLNIISSLNPEKFNRHLVKVIHYLLQNLSAQSKIFTLHNKLHNQKTYPQLFIDLPSSTSTPTTISAEPDASQIKKMAKETATEAVKNLKIEKSNNPSKEIDKLIKKLPSKP